MKPKKLTMKELEKMDMGEIPMTEEGERRLAEMKEMGASLKSSISAARVVIATIPKFSQAAFNSVQVKPSALLLATPSFAFSVKAFQESMRPFIEQMAVVLNEYSIIKGKTQEVYENEKRYYEEKFYLKIRGYDTFWRWMCEELDRRIFDNGEQSFKLDYEMIVNYYGAFYRQQMDRRDKLATGETGQISDHHKLLPTNTVSGVSIKKQSKRLTFNEFTEYFFEPEEIEVCLEALRRIEPPLINEKGKWIGRKGSKAKFAAWIRRLEDCNKIHFVPNKKLMVPLVNSYFPGLNFGIDARTFADPDRDALDAFTALILQ